jgi:hypothetical protein
MGAGPLDSMTRLGGTVGSLLTGPALSIVLYDGTPGQVGQVVHA